MAAHPSIGGDRPAAGEDIATLPVALLVPLFEAPGAEPLMLSARDLLLGTSASCDLKLPFAELGVLPEHARLRWCGDGFELSSAREDAPVALNDQPIPVNATAALRPGCTVSLAGARYHFAGIGGMHGAGMSAGGESDHERLLYGLATLSPETLADRALALLRHVAPSARVALVASDSAGEFSEFLPAVADESVAAHRERIEHVFACGETLQDAPVTTSACVRVQPIFGPNGHPLAAAVLLWEPGIPATVTAEIAAASAALAHIGLAFRNALLYSRLATLHRHLEQRVIDRTRALEESRAQLVAQDRLATLGRLVAAIAHELNNPAGAIASLAGTLDRLLPGLYEVEARLAQLFPGPVEQHLADAWLERARAAALDLAPDSRRRRELEADWSALLAGANVRGAEVVAAKLARTGLDPATFEPAGPLAGEHALEFVALIEQQYTFRRSLASLGECAGNVARIVGGLKTYAHLDKSVAEVGDVRRGIEAALLVLHSRIPVAVTVETRLDPIREFLHRPGELIQVWTNLLDNALRAVGEHGRLVVACREEGRHAVVEVTDSGAGVPASIAPRIFELDVTTRGPSAGLGLGLAICRNLVEENHGGSITFESRPGCTKFCVRLPLDPPHTSQEPVT